MSMPDTGWQVALPAQAELAERPVWDPDQRAMIWVNIKAGELHRFTPAADGRAADDAVIVDLDVSIGAAAPRQRGGYILAAADGFRLTRPDGSADGDPVRPAGMGPGLRFNDAACDPAGRFWAGSVALDKRAGAAALYRLDADGTITTALTGITESNGLGWSPDGATMYYIDSGAPALRVQTFGYDLATGHIEPRPDLVAFAKEDETSDGLTVDAEGCVWIAFWGGSQVRRYSPAGELLDRVVLPVSQPSCPGFGGDDLSLLYVTSAWQDMSPAKREAQPQAGDIFLISAGVRGLPNAGYAG